MRYGHCHEDLQNRQHPKLEPLLTLDDTNIDVLYTLHVYPIGNQFWQFPLYDVYQLWQPDEFHLLLQG
jgi:hypothetical protein